MQGDFDVVVIGVGSDGPFADEEFPLDRDKDRNYPFAMLQGADGAGTPIKATFAPGLNWKPVLFKAARVTVELRSQGKFRCHGEALAA